MALALAPTIAAHDDLPVRRPDLRLVGAGSRRRPPGPEATLVRPAALRPAALRPPALRPAGCAERPSAATYRRRRTVAVGLVAAAVMAVWLGVHSLAGGAVQLPPTRSIAQRTVVVRPGDTLWSIALANGAKGDIRPMVDALSAEVHGQPLQVGEQLLLP